MSSMGRPIEIVVGAVLAESHHRLLATDGDTRLDEPVVDPGDGEAHIPIILLVEDEVLVRLTTAEILRDAGYDVLEAVNADEALAILATGHPLDLVLTDIRMPGTMDGLELTIELKRTRPHMPVAILSSHLAYGVAHHADRFVAKPYGPDQLLEAVHELIGADLGTMQARTAS